MVAVLVFTTSPVVPTAYATSRSEASSRTAPDPGPTGSRAFTEITPETAGMPPARAAGRSRLRMVPCHEDSPGRVDASPPLLLPVRRAAGPAEQRPSQPDSRSPWPRTRGCGPAGLGCPGRPGRPVLYTRLPAADGDERERLCRDRLAACAPTGARGRTACAAPAYVKGHSYGEYIFDWGWANAAERARLQQGALRGAVHPGHGSSPPRPSDADRTLIEPARPVAPPRGRRRGQQRPCPVPHREEKQARLPDAGAMPC